MNKVQKPYFKSISELEATLGTSAAFGLDEKRAKLRYEPQHANGFFYTDTRNFTKRIIEMLSDPILIMLFIMVIISAIFGSTVMSIISGIFLLLGVRAALFAYTKARKIIVSNAGRARPRVTVIRSGKKLNIDSGKVVVGDLICVVPGDILPCDARIVKSDRLKTRNFIGEGDYIEVEPDALTDYTSEQDDIYGYKNMLFAGSIVTNGTATAIVTAIGVDTYVGEKFGGIKIGDASAQPETLKKLRKFTKIYELAALAAVLVFTVIGVFSYGVNNLLFTFMLTLSVAVSALGEMFNILCILIIAGNVRNAAINVKNNDAAILKSYDNIENIAKTDTLFLVGDKTITDGVNRVVSVFTAGKSLMPDNFGEPTIKRAARYYAILSRYSDTTNDCDIEFSEFAAKSLKINGTNDVKFVSRTQNDGIISVSVNEKGILNEISVTSDVSIIENCEGFGLDLGTSVFATNEKKRLLDFCREAVGRGGKIRIITTKKNNGKLVFEGVFVFRKLVSRSVSECVAKLKTAGVETVLFLKNGGLSEVSEAALAGISIGRSDTLSKKDFEESDEDISACIGKYRVYLGFDAEFISKLVAEYKNTGRTVTVFSDDAYGYKSFYKADVSATANDSGQIIRSAADFIVDKSSVKGGGVNGIFKMIAHSRQILLSLKKAFVYLLCTQSMRLIYVVLPLIFGASLLTPEELLFSSLVFDIFAVMSLAFIKPKYEMSSAFEPINITSPRKLLRTEFIISVIASVFVVATSLILIFAADVNIGIPAFILLILSQAGIYSLLVFKK